jgi:hypothetical protein
VSEIGQVLQKTALLESEVSRLSLLCASLDEHLSVQKKAFESDVYSCPRESMRPPLFGSDKAISLIFSKRLIGVLFKKCTSPDKRSMMATGAAPTILSDEEKKSDRSMLASEFPLVN